MYTFVSTFEATKHLSTKCEAYLSQLNVAKSPMHFDITSRLDFFEAVGEFIRLSKILELIGSLTSSMISCFGRPEIESTIIFTFSGENFSMC